MSFIARFDIEFSRLNPAQQRAVEHIEGPLLILAGPGTGKTQTVALRLANILRTTQAKPHNLLALTFTEAGAIALKDRLARIIGPDAYGIHASTFHSFAARLAATFPTEFGRDRESATLDELGSFELIRELLTKDEYEFLRPATTPDLYIRDIIGAIATVKREGYTPASFSEKVADERAELAREERINPRTKKPFTKILAAEKRLAKAAELARLYGSYQTALRERELVDYDDLILDVVDALRDPAREFLLGYLQENYLYVTVDEFQDTNGSQDALLRAWASYDRKPNLCVVGDDDQSIYRFQGASLANILEFRALYDDVEIVTLTTNYRSTQPILDASRGVIEANAQRLTNEIPGLSKILTAAATEAAAIPRALTFATEEDETAYVVREIQSLIARGVPAREIAVLYRKRKHGDIASAYLTRAGVPHHRTDGSDALTHPFVTQLVALIKAVGNPRDGQALLAALFSHISGIATADAYRLARAIDRDTTLLDIFTTPSRLDELAVATEARPAITFNEPETLRAFAGKFLAWTAASHTITLTELVEHIAAESGIAAAIVAEKAFDAAEAVAAFTSFVRQFEVNHPTENAAAGIANLIATLTTMRSENFAIRLPARELDAVRLMTAHGAKGLEFAHVFVIHAVDDDWGGRKKPEKLALPNLVPTAGEDDLIEDERRLFYVALTRAKRALTVTVAKNYAGRDVTPSRFLTEMPDATIERASVTLRPEEKLPFIVPTELAPPLDPESRLFLTSLVERFRLSPTALNAYLSCPRQFLLEQLLRIPTSVETKDRAGAIFGSAIHSAFEEWYRRLKETGTTPDDAVAIRALERRLAREPLTPVEQENFVRDVTRAATRYLAHAAPTAVAPLEIEYNFGAHDVRLPSGNETIGDIPLTGKVDRIDAVPETERDCRIVDYKSQKPYSRNAILGLTANATGDGYRQLVFYKLLSELDHRFFYRVAEVALAFVRPADSGDFVTEVFAPTSEEVAKLKAQIIDVFGRIKTLDFACVDDAAKCRDCRLKELCGR